MTFEEEMRSALATFVVEAAELLTEMESGLLNLERGDGDDDTLDSVFRAAHTIKGSAGLFGLDDVVAFTHVMESVLDRLRSREIQISAELVGVLLQSKDHLAFLIEGVSAGPTASDEQQAEQQAAIGAGLVAQLSGLHDRPDSVRSVPSDGESLAAASDGDKRRMHVSVRFGADTLRSGMDPISFIRYLSTVGDVISVTTIADMLPALEPMDAETCYLDFEVTLNTDASVQTVEGVFEFVWDDSDIRVLTAESSAVDHADLVKSFPPHAGREVFDALVRGGTIGAPELAKLVRKGGGRGKGHDGADATTTGAANGKNATAKVAKSPKAGGRARSAVSHPAQRASDRRPSETSTIRVDASRLDRLIDTVGELLIAGAGAGLAATLSGDESLRNSMSETMRLIEGVRDDALRLRMVPIGTTFSRFQRVVRDVSTALAKNVALEVTGGETEVDKALMEHIADPLMHLVRNSLDHGIESPDVRVAHGKPARGIVRLAAYHDSGSIVVVVEDDGGGINAESVFAKAVERGLVDPAAPLTEKETYALIFEPGFSTVTEVSNLSGRGVGLDVVKRNVASLRGTIDIESRPGKGTTVRMRLPLTLAIIDGFLVGVGSATFVIPLDRVVECVELPQTSQRRDYLDLRGEVLPLIRLWSQFGVVGDRPRRESVVVVEHNGMKTGLVVDALRGEFQTVIKPLGKMFEHVEGVGGSTIMGNGDVALIIDVAMLVGHVMELAGAH